MPQELRPPKIIAWTLEALLLAGAVVGAVLSSRAEDWEPLALLALLTVVTAGGDQLGIQIRGQRLTAGFIGMVLAMCLLGPAPAVAIALAVATVDSASSRLSPSQWLTNLSTHAVFTLVGGLLMRLAMGDVHHWHPGTTAHSVIFTLSVFGIFLVTNTINFAMVASYRVTEGRSLWGQTRDLFVPLLPAQAAIAALTAILAVAYVNLGLPTLLGAVIVLGIFQYLANALLRSEERADQLEARSMHLASLQLGVLTTLVETLSLRDRGAARHAAAVARYARELADEIGCGPEEQDLVHTAGLLHDIGKFAFPDRILHAEVLSDEDWAMIRRHPQDGATLVGRLDGYGPVAEAILYHHEHVDGGGYPAGLIGNEIPLLSRILAICSAYDTMTSRDGYRTPMTHQDAIHELRRSAGRHFDGDLVESFVGMLERDGPVTSTAGERADFEAELAFERRARAIASGSSR